MELVVVHVEDGYTHTWGNLGVSRCYSKCVQSVARGPFVALGVIFFLWLVTTVIYALWKTDTVTILKKVQINLDPLNLVSHWIKTCTTSDFCSKEAWKQLFLSLTFAKENKSFNRKRDIHPFIVAESRGEKLINEMQFKIGVKKYKNDHVKSAEEINVTLERRWRQIAHSY